MRSQTREESSGLFWLVGTTCWSSEAAQVTPTSDVWAGRGPTIQIVNQKLKVAHHREEMFLAQAKAVVQDCKVNVDQRLASRDEGSKAVAICDTARPASANRREEPVKYPCLARTGSVSSLIER